jgi:hypothetical protein
MMSLAADLQDWFDSLDPTKKVGSRHHTVPKFYLERWADKSGQLQVYSRVTSKFRTQNVMRLAVRDFYTIVTIVTIDDELDSRMEDMFSHIEGQAAAIFKGLLS